MNEPVLLLRMSQSPVSELFLVVMSRNPTGWEHFSARVPSLRYCPVNDQLRFSIETQIKTEEQNVIVFRCF